MAIHNHKIWGCGILGVAKASNLQSFLCENRVFHQFTKVFSPLKVSRYTVAVGLDLNHRHALIACRGTSVTTTPIQHIPQNFELPGPSQSVPPLPLILGSPVQCL